jgi:predicted 2-oxoglutarate/Fe(II)-dependent dioxygenase YbiX
MTVAPQARNLQTHTGEYANQLEYLEAMLRQTRIMLAALCRELGIPEYEIYNEGQRNSDPGDGGTSQGLGQPSRKEN